MKEVDGDILLHTGPGGHRCDCGHAPDTRSYYIRLYLEEGGVPYRFDICSLACLRRVCEQKNIDDVSLNGSGWVPVKPHGRKRERIGETT